MQTPSDTSHSRRATSAGYLRPAQPLHAIDIPGALLRLETVSALTGLAPSTIRRDAASGKLQVTRVSARCTRVRSDHAKAYLEVLAKGDAK